MNKTVTSFILSILFVGLFLFISCKDNSGPSVDELTEEQQTAISYFKEIALGLEFGSASAVTRKWTEDMNIYVGGSPDAELQQELFTIISDLNRLFRQGDFSISTTSDSSSSNAYLFFGTHEEFAERVPEVAENVEDNYGLFYFWWNSSDELYRMASYVDMQRTESQSARKHLLREELTQSLGLAKDSDRFSDSIFNSSYDVQVTAYSEVDEHVIQLLYHPEMEAGLDESRAESRLLEIIDDVVPD